MCWRALYEDITYTNDASSLRRLAILMTSMLLLLVMTDLLWDTFLSNFHEFRGIYCIVGKLMRKYEKDNCKKHHN